ncbi:hypothetical protein M8J75_015504 [Diaphorina citri]|nr:hypothetical protein M8J75_015504 [Diaphorina citri]
MKNKKRMKTEDKAEADEDGVEEEEETEAGKEEKEGKIGEEDVKENERTDEIIINNCVIQSHYYIYNSGHGHRTPHKLAEEPESGVESNPLRTALFHISRFVVLSHELQVKVPEIFHKDDCSRSKQTKTLMSFLSDNIFIMISHPIVLDLTMKKPYGLQDE